MYIFSRLLLMAATIAGMGCLVVLAAIAWPASGVVAVLLLVVRQVFRRGQVASTTLGSARWASASELRSLGMLDAASGLILGRIAARGESSWTRLRGLFNGRIGAKDACLDFWAGLRGKRGLLVRLPKAIHTAVFSPSGGGKGVSCVLPFLFSEPGSCVVVDFKGENAAITADYRRKQFGHRVVLLDPFKVVTQSPDTFCPLQWIDKDSPYAIDRCNDLANALVIKSPEAKEPHWDASAEAFIAAILATVVQYGDRGESRSLQANLEACRRCASFSQVRRSSTWEFA